MLLQVGEELAAADGRDDAVLVHLLDDERHGQDGGRADLRERLDQDRRRGDALQVADARAHGIGIQQAERHLVGVRHREDGQEDGTLVLVLRIPGVEHRRAEVAVAQHHALGRSGGAGRIDQGGHVHRVGRDHAPVAGEGVVVLLDEFEGLDVDDQVEARERGLAHFLELAARHEERLGLGVREDALHLAGRQLVEHRHGHAAIGRDGEEGDAPVRHVLGQDGDLVEGAHAEIAEDAGQVVGRLLEPGIGIGLGAVRKDGRGTFGVSDRCVLVQVRQSLEVVTH